MYQDGKGRIDGKYLFNSDAASHLRLKIGDKVSCTARKLSEDQPVVIYKIDSIEEDAWIVDAQDFDNISTSKPIPLKTYQKCLKGEIKEKLNGEIAIDTRPHTPQLIKLMISESGCTFNPTVGDWVQVEAEFGINEDDTADSTLIGYYGLKANDQQFITGKITSFKKKMNYGLIDEKYIFYLDVLQHSNNQNCIPNRGDEVSSNVISSHQKIDDREFVWRCTNLVKIRSANANKSDSSPPQMLEHEIESDDEIDNADCGLSITKNCSLKVTLDATNAKKRIELKVLNTSNQPHKISQVKFNNELLAAQIECNALYTARTIQVDGYFVYGIDVTGRIRGVNKLKLDFQIDNIHTVRRCITVDVKDINENVSARVTHSKAYTKQVYSERRDIVKGVRPVDSPHFIDQRLERFDVPKQLFEEVTTNERYELDANNAELFSSLSVRNYGRFFHSLLYYEEIYMRHEFRQYDQDRGHFIRDGEYLAYEMDKNVFECRPSIIIGDMIYAQSLLQPASAGGEPATYQGYIHRIRQKRLLLKFSEEFHCMYRGEDYKLIFKFSRSKFIKQHNAVERIAKKMIQNGFEFLFPTAIKSGKRLQLSVQLIDSDMILDFPKQTVPWFNTKLNEIQRQAVFNVLRGEVKMCPYLVFGPPVSSDIDTLYDFIL